MARASVDRVNDDLEEVAQVERFARDLGNGVAAAFRPTATPPPSDRDQPNGRPLRCAVARRHLATRRPAIGGGRPGVDRGGLRGGLLGWGG